MIIKVYASEQHDDDWPESNLGLFIAWLNSLYHDIPEIHRQSAKIDINATRSYDDTYANIAITYERPPTEEEYTAAKLKMLQREESQRNQELAILKSLRQKYPDA